MKTEPKPATGEQCHNCGQPVTGHDQHWYYDTGVWTCKPKPATGKQTNDQAWDEINALCLPETEYVKPATVEHKPWCQAITSQRGVGPFPCDCKLATGELLWAHESSLLKENHVAGHCGYVQVIKADKHNAAIAAERVKCDARLARNDAINERDMRHEKQKRCAKYEDLISNQKRTIQQLSEQLAAECVTKDNLRVACEDAQNQLAAAQALQKPLMDALNQYALIGDGTIAKAALAKMGK